MGETPPTRRKARFLYSLSTCEEVGKPRIANEVGIRQDERTATIIVILVFEQDHFSFKGVILISPHLLDGPIFSVRGKETIGWQQLLVRAKAVKAMDHEDVVIAFEHHEEEC